MGIYSSRLNGIQILRGLAALAIIFYHIKLQFTLFVPNSPDFTDGSWYWLAHKLGFLGVDFFFVLSGFIIYRAHSKDLGQPNQGAKYFLKRFLRIQPLLWTIILVKQVYLSTVIKEPIDLPVILRTAFTLPGENMIGVIWTLTYEWIFYLFFLSSIFLGKRFFVTFSSCWAITILSLNLIPQRDPSLWLEKLTSPYIILFLSGIVVCIAAQKWSTPSALTKKLFLISSVLLLLLGIVVEPFNLSPHNWTNPFDMSLGRYYWSLCFSVVIWTTVIYEDWFKSRWFTPLLLIGNASYAIYLFHNEMLQAFIRIGHKFKIYNSLHLWLSIWGFAIVLLISGILIHIVIEKPIIKWSGNFVRRLFK